MEAVAHNKAFAKKVGIPQSVGQDFAKADKGKTFRKGGDAMATKKKMAVNPAMAMMAARALRTPAPVQAAPMMAPPAAAPMGGMPGMKKGGSAMKKMAKGGSADPKSMKYDVEAGSNKHGKFGESKVQKSGHTRGTNLGDSGKKVSPKTMMAKGGSASSRADGIATKGKTKGKWC